MKSFKSLLNFNYYAILLVIFTLLLCFNNTSSRFAKKLKLDNNNLNNSIVHTLIDSKTGKDISTDSLYHSSSNYGNQTKKLVEQKKLELEWTEDSKNGANDKKHN
jgi:hypothetical protein